MDKFVEAGFALHTTDGKYDDVECYGCSSMIAMDTTVW